MKICSIAVCIVTLLLFGCGTRAVGSGDYEIRGSIVDDQTSAPVCRSDIYVFAYNEAVGHAENQPLKGEPTFAIRMPRPSVRLSVHDRTNFYQHYEKTLEVPRTGLVCNVRLVPTRFVVMKGRVLVEKAGSWVPMSPPEVCDYPRQPIGGNPVLSFREETQPSESFYSPIDTNGLYEVRLPCELIRVNSLIDSMNPDPHFIDLTGVTDEILERDIRLIPEPLEPPDPEHEARLDPARFVELKGRLMVQDGTTWVPLTPEIARRYGKPDNDLSFRLDCKHYVFCPASQHPDGSFEVRVPRDRLLVSLINTELGPVTPLDLTGVTGDVVERDIHLVAPTK